MLFPIHLQEELRYRLALTKIPQIGVVLARSLLEKFGTAKAIFEAKRSHLEHTEGMGKVRTEQIKNFREFTQIEKEIRFMEKYRIRALCFMDEAYPKRLLHCYDPPTILFCKGNADLNAEKILGVVGTRNNTEYGRSMTEALIHSLSEWNVTIVSGMAFGIDALAHKACLRHQLPTVGVLAHGLAHMYPGEHKKMAGDIITATGAMVTEYWSSEEPDKHLFPARNRIVAGMCDALIVMESGLKGGSMLTAELAAGYNRDIFAFPGRANDLQSEGCNNLIKTNKAQLLSRPEELAEYMGWKRQPAEKQGMQFTLPLSLNAQEKKVLEQFTSQHTMHIEQLNAGCDLPMHSLSAVLLELEMQGFIRSLPGKMYKRF